jgi:hypothetical protein
MSAVAQAANVRPSGWCEFVPSSFVGKSGASFWRVVFKPAQVSPQSRQRTGLKNKGTRGTGTS